MGEAPMKFLLLVCLVASAFAYEWDSCGTRFDRLKTQKLSVAGSLTAGSKVTVTATGATDLHVPLDSGAWQVRIWEDGVAKNTHTEVGDLMKALKFLDAKNTTFEMKVSFTLPAKKASGKFDANLVAVDQSKANYLCLDIKYSYAAVEALAAPPTPTCLHDVDTEDHKCFEACSPEGKKFSSKGLTSAGTCPDSYNFVEKTKIVLQCPDGITNLRYCPDTKLNVTMKTKGEGGVVYPIPDTEYLHNGPAYPRYGPGYPYDPHGSFTDAIVQGVKHCTKDTDCPSSYCQNGVCHACGDECCLTDKDCPGSYCVNDRSKFPPYTCHAKKAVVSFTESSVKGQGAYCMNDATKHAPFYCHCPPLPATCKTQKDCTNPWYTSYCMNDATKHPPYVCKQVMPPTCKTDKDCAR